MTRNAVIGDFLRSRREKLVRADHGLPPVRRRTSGLRREEIAYLTGVSVTWYTWLEQGRDITPSRHVLDALARTMHLSAAEHSYLLSLAGYFTSQSVDESISQAVPVDVQRFLDGLAGYPAYAIGADWGMLAWNSAYSALYPNIDKVSDSDRNLLWLLFADPYLRDLIPDWGLTVSYNVAAFRAKAGPRLAEPPFAHVVERLLEASPAFRSIWRDHSIDVLSSRERLFRHPVVGDIQMQQHNLTPLDHPDLHLVIYTPVPATDTPMRLRWLSGRGPDATLDGAPTAAGRSAEGGISVGGPVDVDTPSLDTLDPGAGSPVRNGGRR